jgi:hypothetical protein
MSGQAAALAACIDRWRLANLSVVSTLRELSLPSERRTPSPLDFYLSWMSQIPIKFVVTCPIRKRFVNALPLRVPSQRITTLVEVPPAIFPSALKGSGAILRAETTDTRPRRPPQFITSWYSEQRWEELYSASPKNDTGGNPDERSSTPWPGNS